ncbi:MAG: phosphate/phosphite/phosphonate ABC transporter substrate-binding protein [Rhodospirillaceae bacterium]
MKLTFKSVLTAAAVAVLAGVAGAAKAEAPKQIRFGLLPAEDPTQMVEQFNGIAKHIGEKMGLPVNVKVSESYNALIEAMRAGHLEIVYVGGGQYLKMLDLGMKVVPLVLNKDTNKRTYYKSCIVTKPDSGIKTFADLKGKTFAFVSPTSTSGGVAPTYMLLKNKINPDKDFKRKIFAGKHDASFLAVKNGKVDAGAVGDFYFWRWQDRGIFKMERYDEPNDKLINAELSIIGCQKVPNTPMVTQEAFGAAFIDGIRKAFLSLPTETANAYKIWPSTGFVPTSHADFVDLAEMAKLKKKIAAQNKKK